MAAELKEQAVRESFKTTKSFKPQKTVNDFFMGSRTFDTHSNPELNPTRGQKPLEKSKNN